MQSSSPDGAVYSVVGFVIFHFYLDCFCLGFGACLGSLFSSDYIKSYPVARGSRDPFSTLEKGKFCCSGVQYFFYFIFINLVLVT